MPTPLHDRLLINDPVRALNSSDARQGHFPSPPLQGEKVAEGRMRGSHVLRPHSLYTHTASIAPALRDAHLTQPLPLTRPIGHPLPQKWGERGRIRFPMSLLTTARALAARASARLRAFAPPRPPDTKAWRAAPFVTIDGPRYPVHAPRDYAAFAREGFMQNPIAYRSVRMIAEAIGCMPMLLYDGDSEIEDHPLLTLVRRPSPTSTTADLLEQFVGFLLVSGNAYLEAVTTNGSDIRALYALRPDRMTIVPGPDGWPDGHAYTLDGRTTRITGDAAPGTARILHLKLFHPLDDHYGLSPIEAASSAIDLHNTASQWNKALLDNSARPSGALVYTARDGNLTTDQFDRLKRELESGFQGAGNAGRPLLLEGGLDWKAMSLSPKDLDFIEARNSAAREIALALGVPPMLLAIPGDNTYSNYQEATRAFWRQTVLPLATRISAALSQWLAQPQGLTLKFDLDQVDALTPEREALWTRLDAATFLTPNEKRAAAGYDPLADGDDGLAAKFNPHHDALGRFTSGPGGENDDTDPADKDSNLHLVGRGPPRPPPRPPGRGHNRPPGSPPTGQSGVPGSQPLNPQFNTQAYRFYWQLRPEEDTVATGTIDGKEYVGSNSTANGYSPQDREAAMEMRGRLIENYSDVFRQDNAGYWPNYAVSHAEATILLRMARENGGSLDGKQIEIHVDKQMCSACLETLPYLSRELGNPTVRFVYPLGNTRTLRDGQWYK